MRKTNTHKWIFVSRFRTNACGWKASKLACKRIREAVSEIKKANRKDSVLGAQGSIRFMEKLWPALQHVNSSSGALGTAVYNAMDVLVDVVIKAPADEKTRGNIVKIVSADKSPGMLVKDIISRLLDLRKIK